MRPSYNEKLYNTAERHINLLKYTKLPKIIDVLHKFCPITKGLIIRQADFVLQPRVVNEPAGDHVARFNGAVWISTWMRANRGYITPRRPLVSPLWGKWTMPALIRSLEFTFLTTEHVRLRQFASRICFAANEQASERAKPQRSISPHLEERFVSRDR